MTTTTEPAADVLSAAAFPVDRRATDIGPAHPLTAAYCAERAAFAILRAETAPEPTAGQLFRAARQWRDLGLALATHPSMNRPRDDRDQPRR